MMPMKDDDDNWLGFSLSPHMKMEADNTASDPYNHHFSHHHHHHHHQAEAPPHPSSSTFVGYGLSENGGFQSPLSVMPLKSDGSLCIMEALSRSHSQGSSPKLENFLGGATPMATQQRDASSMFLSLDSSFYNQDPFRQQQYYYYYNNGLNYANQFINPPISDQGHEFPCPKTWTNDNEHNQEYYENHFNNSTMVENKGHHHHELQQSLSLSMSPGSQSSCVTKTITTDCVGVSMRATKKRGGGVGSEKQTVHRKSIDTFGQRTSQFRGVTRHRWTGRYEAHLWDNSIKKEGQTRKGRQVYLGGYDMEEKAARAYDLAALKYWGCSTHINFPLENYHQELEEMKNMSRQEYVAHLRSSGFSRGASMYRGVTRHHQHGRWQARIGRVAGNKDLYLGTFSTQEEAAEAYDVAAIKFRGANAVTNFDMSRYDVEKIMASNTLPSGETARRKNVTGPIITPEDVTVEPHDVKALLTRGDYHQNHSFSAGPQDLICMGSGQRVVDEATNHHFSNPSSLVTSLSSSREGSPDRNGAQLVFANPNSLETKFISSSGNVNSWIQASNLPVFTSWNDITLV